MSKPTLIIDSSFLCYRAKFTKFKVGKEVPGGVILGFLYDLGTLARVFNTDRFMFFWDSKKSVRKEIFPEYKEKRKTDRDNKTKEEKENDRQAYKQFDILRTEIIPGAGFKNNFRQKGYESDDLMARYVMESGRKMIMVTRDADMLQILDYCDIFDLTSNIIHKKENFMASYGIAPTQWAEVKAIAGCKSDAVPGVVGIGETRAIAYLRKKLKTDSKAYQDIEKSKKLIKRNRLLVKLPYEGTKLVKYKKHEFCCADLRSALAQHDLVLERDQLKFWRNFEAGLF